MVTYPPLAQQYPLSPYDVSLCVEAATTAASVAGADTRFPRTGFRTMQGRVWMEAYPRYAEYTWDLMAITVEMVEKELSERGYFKCNWELRLVEDEGEEYLVGWGNMGRVVGRRSGGKWGRNKNLWRVRWRGMKIRSTSLVRRLLDLSVEMRGAHFLG